MDTGKYLDWMDKLESLPNIMDGYGLSQHDFERFDSDPALYLPFVTYLLSIELPEYFINEDALSHDELEQRLNEFIKQHVQLV